MKTEAWWHWVTYPKMCVWLRVSSTSWVLHHAAWFILHDTLGREFFKVYIFIYLLHMGYSFRPGIKPGPRALGTQRLSQWTIREFPLWGENFVSKCGSLAEINWEGANFISRMGQSIIACVCVCVCLPDTPKSSLQTTYFLKVCLCLVKKVPQEGQIHTAT